MNRLILFCTITFANVFCICAFLLDTSNSLNHGVGTNGQYLKASDYFDNEKLQDRKLEQMLALLSAQVQQKFDKLDGKTCNCTNENDNMSESVDNLKQKYRALEDKCKNLHQVVEILQNKYDVQNLELAALRNETNYLDQQLLTNDSKLQHQIAYLDLEYVSQENEHSSMQNKSHKLEMEILKLQTLQTIKPIIDLHNLQQLVQQLDSKTHMLSVNERARNQDFLALYNETLTFKVLTNDRIKTLETNQNSTQTKMTEKVAIRSCAMGSYAKGMAIPFDKIQDHIGVDDLSSLRSNGSFVCKKPGLYIVTVTITSGGIGAEYYVLRNQKAIGWSYLSNDDHLDSGTTVGFVDLKVNDTLWVKASSTMPLQSDWSCMTIIKLK